MQERGDAPIEFITTSLPNRKMQLRWVLALELPTFWLECGDCYTYVACVTCHYPGSTCISLHIIELWVSRLHLSAGSFSIWLYPCNHPLVSLMHPLKVGVLFSFSRVYNIYAVDKETPLYDSLHLEIQLGQRSNIKAVSKVGFGNSNTQAAILVSMDIC